MRTQHIYFDPDDAHLDNGYGWNVIDPDSAIAARFLTEADAIRFCERSGLPYILTEGAA